MESGAAWKYKYPDKMMNGVGGNRGRREITSQNLVASLPAEHHLHTHRFDLAAKEIHWGARTDRRHVVCLEVIDHLGYGVQTLLHCENMFVMDRSKISRRVSGR
jgi:hypothetical protein